MVNLVSSCGGSSIMTSSGGKDSGNEALMTLLEKCNKIRKEMKKTRNEVTSVRRICITLVIVVVIYVWKM